MNKGIYIKLQLHDGRIVTAIVQSVNGSTLTVKCSDGLIYETSRDTIDSRWVYHVS